MSGEPLTGFFVVYMSAWGVACMAALFLMARHRDAVELFQSRYWRFLLQDWKLITFVIAAASVTVIAPYTGDPTWDYIDACFMSVLAYATAPWAVGTLYLTARRRRRLVMGYIALCVWMFSASWSYDLYLVIRDGQYPFTWLPNIFASGVLYACAGLMWNLEWQPGRGVIFGFMASGWPSPPDAMARLKVLFFALPFMIIVLAMILPFVL